MALLRAVADSLHDAVGGTMIPGSWAVIEIDRVFPLNKKLLTNSVSAWAANFASSIVLLLR